MTESILWANDNIKVVCSCCRLRPATENVFLIISPSYILALLACLVHPLFCLMHSGLWSVSGLHGFCLVMIKYELSPCLRWLGGVGGRSERRGRDGHEECDVLEHWLHWFEGHSVPYNHLFPSKTEAYSLERQRGSFSIGLCCTPQRTECPLFVYGTCQRLNSGAAPDNCVTL